MKIQRLRGMHDITGSEAEGFAHIESLARQVFGLFGFEEIRTPVLEEKELFTRALGTETDVVQKEMYSFTDRSQTPVAMRPEGTAGVVRAYLENNFDKTQGFCKFFYSGPMFRSERPQAGRLRQFHQIGVEVLGSDSPYSDAETIQCLTAFLDAAGVRGYQVKLNNLGTLEERGVFRGKLHDYFSGHLGALCQDCTARHAKNVFRILDCKNPSCREIIKKSPTIADYLTVESRAHFDAVCQALSAAGIPYAEESHMVRGLDYYTKTVFEITHPKLGAQDALAAGGRYDRLIESFGGARAGAVGFAAGVERLLMVLETDTASTANTSYFIATLGDAAQKEGFRLLGELRAGGLRALMDFSAKSLKSQMRSADKTRARTVLILGEDEIQKKTVVVKDMENGTQKEIERKEIVRLLSHQPPK